MYYPRNPSENYCKIILLFITTIFVFVGGDENHTHFHCDTPDEELNVFKGNQQGRTFHPGDKWPLGVVKYKLDKSLTLADRLEVREAFEDISSKTCIKFQPRSVGDTDYTEISVDDKVCGRASLCRIGGAQYTKFGTLCRNMNTMVHELGHTLCLGHEHSRWDRDEYLDYRKCAEKEISGKNTKMDTRGTMYDYGSAMQYDCGGCFIGWPKFGGGDVSICRTSKGLSVIDADRLNEFYECGGCHGHRWIIFERLNEKLKELLPLGKTQDGRLLYACRGHIEGKIAIGKYVQESNVCYVLFEKEEHRLDKGFEVLSVPDEFKEEYKLEDYKGLHKLFGVPIKGGRSVKGDPSYIVSGLVFSDSFTSFEKSVGEMFESQSHTGIAYFPWRARERHGRMFSILTCKASF